MESTGCGPTGESIQRITGANTTLKQGVRRLTNLHAGGQRGDKFRDPASPDLDLCLRLDASRRCPSCDQQAGTQLGFDKPGDVAVARGPLAGSQVMG